MPEAGMYWQWSCTEEQQHYDRCVRTSNVPEQCTICQSEIEVEEEVKVCSGGEE